MKNLSTIRKQNQISQLKLADSMGVSRSTVAMWETGKSQPDNEVLVKLAKFFNCTTDYLLGVTEEANLVRFDTGVDYEGDRVYIDIVKEFLDKGLTKEEIDEIIQMGLAWKDAKEAREAKENSKKKPNKD